MNLWRHYVVPTSLAEALSALASAAQPVLPIAGGTDLLLDLSQGRHPLPQTLVDVARVSEMNAIETRDDALFIGAAASLTQITQNPLVALHAPALVEACRLIGGPQVRNVATLGGNVAHALPAADGTIALLALDARVEIAGNGDRFYRPIEGMFMGPGKSVLRAGEELIVGFHIPLRKTHEGSSFRRIMRPQGVALPIVNLAMWVRREAGRVEAARVAVGPGAPKPWRATAAENSLMDAPASDDAWQGALTALLAEVGFRSSPRRASAEYRRHLVGALFADTAKAAWNAAGGS